MFTLSGCVITVDRRAVPLCTPHSYTLGSGQLAEKRKFSLLQWLACINWYCSERSSAVGETECRKFSAKKKKGWGSKYWQNTVIAVPAWVGKQEIKEVQPRRKVVENCRKSWREGLTVQDHSSSVNYFITFPERIS